MIPDGSLTCRGEGELRGANGGKHDAGWRAVIVVCSKVVPKLMGKNYVVKTWRKVLCQSVTEIRKAADCAEPGNSDSTPVDLLSREEVCIIAHGGVRVSKKVGHVLIQKHLWIGCKKGTTPNGKGALRRDT
jgi:hypothetical protein